MPPSGRPIEIKPYLIGDVSSDVSASPAVSNELGGNVGLDLIKYGITENLTADFTVNTDFAQVEADEQQVNLTRFSLFFPEKREFFLENQGFTHSSFERFASMPNPPFHIIVNNSSVSLVGVVQSQIEKIEMETIARQTQGVLRVENRLVTPDRQIDRGRSSANAAPHGRVARA